MPRVDMRYTSLTAGISADYLTRFFVEPLRVLGAIVATNSYAQAHTIIR